MFDSANNVMTYGNSLGWPVPENLKDAVNEYVGTLFENERREIAINEVILLLLHSMACTNVRSYVMNFTHYKTMTLYAV